ncbi:MAG TPA: hypothetical protein VG387_06250 [Rhizomicrobium sp.]|jgi:hypothetical protein|nr:hypothetical protein [Rhizomicrobium sp.]
MLKFKPRRTRGPHRVSIKVDVLIPTVKWSCSWDWRRPGSRGGHYQAASEPPKMERGERGRDAHDHAGIRAEEGGV